MHIDRPGRSGFEYEGLGCLQAWRLTIRLCRLACAHDRSTDRHVRLDLRKTADLTTVPFRMMIVTCT